MRKSSSPITVQVFQERIKLIVCMSGVMENLDYTSYSEQLDLWCAAFRVLSSCGLICPMGDSHTFLENLTSRTNAKEPSSFRPLNVFLIANFFNAFQQSVERIERTAFGPVIKWKFAFSVRNRSFGT